MTSLSLASMHDFLDLSINNTRGSRNKIRGLLAEIAMRDHFAALGFGANISPGGWLFRSIHNATDYTCVVFPAPITPSVKYPSVAALAAPNRATTIIAGEFNRAGIPAFACAAVVTRPDDPLSLEWYAQRIGLPTAVPWQRFPECVIDKFEPQDRLLNRLGNSTDSTVIPRHAVGEEFAKEHLRVYFNQWLRAEISDVDAVFFGGRIPYPVEVKEKTRAFSPPLGDYFGLDVGPFVKLAFYAANRGTLSSMFVVREIDDVLTRNEIDWWYVTFEEMAKHAAWTAIGGGTSMGGGRSSVVRIPFRAFHRLDAAALGTL